MRVPLLSPLLCLFLIWELLASSGTGSKLLALSGKYTPSQSPGMKEWQLAGESGLCPASEMVGPNTTTSSQAFLSVLSYACLFAIHQPRSYNSEIPPLSPLKALSMDGRAEASRHPSTRKCDSLSLLLFYCRKAPFGPGPVLQPTVMKTKEKSEQSIANRKFLILISKKLSKVDGKALLRLVHS